MCKNVSYDLHGTKDDFRQSVSPSLHLKNWFSTLSPHYLPLLTQIVPEMGRSDPYKTLEKPSCGENAAFPILFSVRPPVQQLTTTVAAVFFFILCLFGLHIRDFRVKLRLIYLCRSPHGCQSCYPAIGHKRRRSK